MKAMAAIRVGLAAMAVLLVAGVARAGDQDFTLVNKTGVEIYALHVSPSEHNKWGEDILGVDTLPAGAKANIVFHSDEEAELWDVRVEDEDGNAITWVGFNLLEISKLTLFYDAENEKATAKFE